MTKVSKPRWRRILFNPLWREVSSDPLWSKHFRSVHILYVCLLMLVVVAIVIAFQAEEFWLLSVPTAASVASYFGAKALARRYENILNFLAEHRSLTTPQTLPPPPHGLSGIYSRSIWMVILTFLAVSVYGTYVSVEKRHQEALFEYQLRGK